ncbi:MAG: threonylcarbamoyl-AMP synthase [Bacteroidetes bacterium]|nr:threonylcarbamoyl-AMP synthase [Bacteroidota bacterium]
MLIKIYPENPNNREMLQIVSILQKGGIIIFPTDTIYALGCAANNTNGLEQVCRIMGKKPEKSNLSLLCSDLSHLSDYTTPVDNTVYRLMKRCLPGPYTFVLNANNNIPKIFKQHSKKTVGIRIPDNNIVLELINMLGQPLISSSIHIDDEIEEYITDPELIYEKYEKHIDY